MDTELYERLLNVSFHFVSFRPRSEKEIRIFLGKKIKKYAASDISIIDAVVTRLKDLDYVNDEKFVRFLIAGRQGHAPKGVRVITQELHQKGIDKQLIDRILSEQKNDIDTISQTDLAKKAIQKKLEIWHSYPYMIRKKKCYEFLARRGFDSQTISSVIDDLLGKEYNSSME